MRTPAFRFFGALLLFTVLAQAQENSWTHNEAMLTYFQAAGAIREHALADLEYPDIVQDSLRLFLAQQDSYSLLLSPTEYSRYRASQKNSYHGIGMELAQTRDGIFYGIPYPASPAAQAGILEGDRIIAVNDEPTTNLPLEVLGSRVRGEPGSTLRLTLRTGDDVERSIKIERSLVLATSVSTSADEGTPVVRIYSFTPNTPANLRRALHSIPEDIPFVIDVRGNPGGNLFDAVDAARLFLAPTQTIVEVRGRTSSSVYRCERPATFPERAIWILQDEGTASAAEVFVASLTDNGRATSIGRTSFGKGRTQRIIELMDGSALLLTNGILLTPAGKEWDGTGLSPTIVVDEGPILPALLPLLTTP